MPESVEQLHLILQQSFNPDVTQRGPAEEAIRNLKNIPGSTTLLLQIAAEKQVSVKLYPFCLSFLCCLCLILLAVLFRYHGKLASRRCCYGYLLLFFTLHLNLT